MTDKTGLTLLLDYYGSFLTSRQREIMQMSVDEDMSLSEIAEEIGVSRQGVRDCLSKASRLLEEMEDRLGLVEKDRTLRAVSEKLRSAALTGENEKLLTAALAAADDIDSLVR